MELPIPVPERLPKGLSFPTWVVLDVHGRYPARSPRNPVQAALLRTDTLESLDRRVDALARAPWLHGVLVRVGELQVGAATAWHLRSTLRRLSAAVRTVAFAPRVDMLTMLVASGAREITVPESAEFALTGFTSEVTFLGAFLRRYGVDFEAARIREYKSAYAPLTQERMDEFDREQRETLLRSVQLAWLRDVAQGRHRSPEEVAAWLAEGVMSAARARELGVVDRVAYEDELVGPGTRPFASVARTLLAPNVKAATGGRVAVVNVVGTIVPGRSRNNPLPLPLLGGPQAGSDSVVAALRRAQRDPATKAIVLFVDSGGGSALASDLIWREVTRSRKPVVAVMGDVAASGGYYVLAGARRVIASPGTITGSIGVVSGKMVLRDFNERQGLNPERVTTSSLPGLFSSRDAWSEPERDAIERMNEDAYARFTSRVAAGRGKTPAEVDAVGRGRIWSGTDALEIGLIDELGDLNTGIERACELAGLPFGAPVWTVEAPRRWEMPHLENPAALAGLESRWWEGTLAWAPGLEALR